jgi:hypothetical protein
MGQEILHCSVCGIRIRSSDFENGGALKIDFTAYCSACAPRAAAPESGSLSPTSTRRHKTSTARIPIVTPRHGTEAVGAGTTPPALVWGGAGLLVAVLAAAALVVGGRSRPASPPALPASPTPQVRAQPDPAPLSPLPTAKPSASPPAPRNEATELEELAQLDRKVSDAVAADKFPEGFALLAQARSLHDSLEWTAEIQRRIHNLESRAKSVHPELAGKLEPVPQPGSDGAPAALAAEAGRRDPLPGASPSPEGKPAAPDPATTGKADLFPFVPGPMKWTVLTPNRMSATGGCELRLLEDGSILVSGPIPARSRYALAIQTELRGISGFRLETLPDRSLPGQGPGLYSSGNFVLSEFQVQVIPNPAAESGTAVALDRSASDFEQNGFPVAHAIDGKSDTGWAVLPQLARVHEALFETRVPISSPGPVHLLIVLDHQTIYDHHLLGRFRISATTSKGAVAEFASRVPAIDQARVDQAIQRGVAWLRNPPYPGDYPWSANELILWTFVHAGVPETDPDFQKRLKQMLDSPLDKTYRVALQAMILEELDRVAYQSRLWQCAQFLVDNQCLNGQWNYGTPTEFPKGTPTASRAPVATSAKLDPEGRRIKPKIVHKLAARKTRDGPPDGDNSNSQYAALGLRACFDAGIVIPEETIRRAIKWWVDSQYFDEKKEGEYAAKGWSYTSLEKQARASHTMTAGAISSLTICEYLLGRDWKRSQVLKSGVNWIAQFWVVTGNYYYLYGLERAGILYGTDKFGRYAWYPLGAQWILDHQDASGGWISHDVKKPEELVWNTWDTCFSILFLKHATRPLVASEDRKSDR